MHRAPAHATPRRLFGPEDDVGASETAPLREGEPLGRHSLLTTVRVDAPAKMGRAVARSVLVGEIWLPWLVGAESSAAAKSQARTFAKPPIHFFPFSG